MPIHPGSFLLGLGAAFALPLLSRVIRPLAVEAAAAGMGFFDEARRVMAEQLETLEDIAAEARARREHLVAAAETNGAETNGGEPITESEPTPARARRRGNGAARRQVS
jgi:Protein of unknown function (DUF5132)